VASTAKISAYLENMEFPVTKEEVITYAKGRHAPKDVVNALEKMRGGKFYTIAGIWDAVGTST